MRLLLVEDDKKIAKTLQRGLQEEYYSVDVSHDGKEGLYLATTNEYDVILLDLMLPSMDGVNLCKALRRKRVHTPVIMLTAKGEIEERIEGLDSGANDYLPKPFAFEELLARIRVQLRTPEQGGDTLQVADLVLDRGKKQVSRGGVPIRLTAKEFALLEYLLRRKNAVVSEGMIRENIQSLDEDSSSNVISVYIYRLRNKIDKPFDKPLIHTLRGIGYRVGEDV